jgi:pimeloyl-ACP methyl ester carboxylesterase
VNSSKLLSHGDGFKPHESLESFSRSLDNVFFFDSGLNPEKSVVVLVHGNGDEADTWRYVFTTLSRQFRVVALDLPGFGRSQPIPNGNLESLNAALSRFLDALALQRVHLVGSSLGAVVCTMYASQNPNRVASLTLVGGVGLGFGDVNVSSGIQSLLEPEIGESYYNGLRTLGQDAAFATLEPYYANLQALPKTDLEFLRQRVWARVWSDTQRDAFLAALRSLFDPNLSTISRLERLPLRLIWGEKDNIVSIQSAHRMLTEFPQAKLEVIKGAGHLPHQEQPKAFLEVLEPFLLNLEAQV